MILWARSDEELQRGTALEVVTATSAAARLGVSEARLRQLSLTGAIKHVDQVAKARLYLVNDVEQLKAARAASLAHS